MERLTFTDLELEMNGCDCVVRDVDETFDNFCEKVCEEFQYNCPFDKLGRKLKAYEDTGLTPEQILAMDEEYTKLARELGEYKRLEEQGRLIKLPISVENVIDKLFSHNEIVALWCKVEKDVTYHKLVWRGMAWDIPKKFKSCGFVKFFGTIPQNISQADTINIEVLLTEEAEKALEEMGE